MEFKERLKLLRNERVLPTTQLAAHLDKSESAIRMWETGKSKPDADTLIKLAEYFDCATDYLLGLSDFRHLKDSEKDAEIRELQKKIKIYTDKLKQINNLSIMKT